MTRTELDKLFDRLFPITRSITGEGYRESLDILREYIPFNYIDVKSDTKVFDWEVPEEWNITDAYVLDPDGRKIIDFQINNLHVVNYSEPIDIVLELEDLKKNLHSIPELPMAIPYITSYYKRTWGFSLSHNQLLSLKNGKYRAVIESSFSKGFVRIGECVLPGKSKKEILLTSYLCHPSLANNELGGPLSLVFIYSMLKKMKNRRYTYRFIINPETIGSLSYLSQRFQQIKANFSGGFVLHCLGGPREKLSYKQSKAGNSFIDNFFISKAKQNEIELRKFSPFGGSDERQYNSPGINLPLGQIGRTFYEEYPEYHNSLDNKTFMDLVQIMKSCEQLCSWLQEIESREIFIRNNGCGEPFLSRHNLYPTMNSNDTRKELSGDLHGDNKRQQRTTMFLLNYCDGSHSLNDIADLLKEDYFYVRSIATLLKKKNLIEVV